MPATVAVVRCDRYDESEVAEAIGRGLGLLGGAERFAGAGETILLKPNLLFGISPESCVSPHPTVFAAVARAFAETGARLTYGDSPGFGRPDVAARKAGLAAVADELGVELADFIGGRELSFPQGRLVKRWHLAKGALDADGIVSIGKLKAHGLTRITGAVKNTFGCVPGARKSEFHARINDAHRFSGMLVDLNRALRPRLFIIDGVVAMEGNGPRNGDPRPMRLLLLSEDPVALDATVCRLVALEPELVSTVVLGEDWGLGTRSDIRYVGDPVDEFVDEGFVVNRSHGSTTGFPGPFNRFMRRWVVPKPVIRKERCTACGTCVSVCPVDPKAVDWMTSGGARDSLPPAHDYGRCIHCYCCQELCPERAIEIEVPRLGRLIHR